MRRCSDSLFYADSGSAGLPLQAACRAIGRIFSCRDDLLPFYRMAEDDPVLSALIRQLRGLRCPVTPTLFEAVVDSVIEQQISLEAARSIENRLIRATNNTLPLNHAVWYCYPEPGDLAACDDSLFRSCGLTRRKGEYIRGLSRRIMDGDLDLERFRRYRSTERIIEELCTIRGIGRWTAKLSALRGLQRLDAFPADDVGVRRFISRYYRRGAPVSPEECRRFGERWGKYQGLAAFYLEVADLREIRPQVFPERFLTGENRAPARARPGMSVRGTAQGSVLNRRARPASGASRSVDR